MSKDELIQMLQTMLDSSTKIAFFGGAGVSTESGIPDFRSENGIFKAVNTFGYPPETLLSHSFFVHNTELFFEYYRSALIVKGVKPNAAHTTLAKLESVGRLNAMITQNIDGLHTLAGSKAVYELHGSIHRNFCTKCRKSYSLEYIEKTTGVPHCTCGGIIKPDVVLYEESLDSATIEGAVRAISAADMLIVGGTSLCVYPAAGLIEYYRGKKLVLINKSSTQYDSDADLVIHEPIGEILGSVGL